MEHPANNFLRQIVSGVQENSQNSTHESLLNRDLYRRSAVHRVRYPFRGNTIKIQRLPYVLISGVTLNMKIYTVFQGSLCVCGS